MDLSWRLLKEEVDDEAFKQTAWGGLDEGWHDHLPEDFDHEGFDAENYNEIIEREYPTGQSGYSPGMKDLRRSQYNHYESPEENEKRFRDLMDNPTREPILVVRDKNGEEHIIAGHHRMAANIESGRPHLPALILDMNKDIQTGEPMDLAMRLLKLDYPDAERDAVLGDSAVPFPEQADEGLGLPEEGWEDEVVNRTHNPESKKTIMCHNFLHDRSPTPEEIQMVEDHISDKEGEWHSHYAGRGIDLQQHPDGNFVYEGDPDAPYEYQRGMQNAGHPTPLLRNKHRRVSMGLERNSRVCGTMVPITNSWENPCPNPECGAWYNGNGAKLADDGG